VAEGLAVVGLPSKRPLTNLGRKEKCQNDTQVKSFNVNTNTSSQENVSEPSGIVPAPDPIPRCSEQHPEPEGIGWLSPEQRCSLASARPSLVNNRRMEKPEKENLYRAHLIE
jgi:hypothetical protein